MLIRKVIATVTVIAILNLSAVPKASAFDFGGLANGLIGKLADLDIISAGLAEDFSFYTTIGKALLKVMNGKSLDSLLTLLPEILDKVDGVNGLSECSEEGADCESLLGSAGAFDWENVSESVEKSVKASVAKSDEDSSNSPITSGMTDNRFRPRITSQINNTKIAAWTQLQDAQHKAFFGAEGQDLIKKGRDINDKILEESVKNTTGIQKLDNTQDILKKAEVNRTLGLSLQQSQIEEQLKTRISIQEGNQTENQQLTISQKQDWKEEIGLSQAQKSAYVESEAFAGFVGSAYTDPGEPVQ